MGYLVGKILIQWEKIWSSIYGSTDNDTPSAFVIASDGSIYSLIRPFGAVNGIEPQGGSMVIRHNKNGEIDLTESLNTSTVLETVLSR